MLIDRSTIDAANEGALMDKTPISARQLISSMAANYLQFGTKVDALSRAAASKLSISIVVDNQRLNEVPPFKQQQQQQQF